MCELIQGSRDIELNPFVVHFPFSHGASDLKAIDISHVVVFYSFLCIFYALYAFRFRSPLLLILFNSLSFNVSHIFYTHTMNCPIALKMDNTRPF